MIRCEVGDGWVRIGIAEFFVSGWDGDARV